MRESTGVPPTKIHGVLGLGHDTELGAHQNTPLTGLMRAYRLGHEFGWQRIAEILRRQIDDPAKFAAALELISTWLFAYVDAATCLAEESYARERERWLRTASASRAEGRHRRLRQARRSEGAGRVTRGKLTACSAGTSTSGCGMSCFLISADSGHAISMRVSRMCTRPFRGSKRSWHSFGAPTVSWS